MSRAVALGRAWAFSDRHAELAHALHYDDLAQLDEVNWQVMDEKYWSEVKEERQAEFLVREFFPWPAITEVGVMSKAVQRKVSALIATAADAPPVTIRQKWYY